MTILGSAITPSPPRPLTCWACEGESRIWGCYSDICAVEHWNWEGRPLFFFKWFLHECNFFVLELYFFSATSWFLLRNRVPWWLWTELQKRLLKRFCNFWMLTALESSNSNTEPIRSKQCLLKKNTALQNKKLHSWRNPVIDLINSSELLPLRRARLLSKDLGCSPKS